MVKLRIWDKTTPLIYNNGMEAQPEQVFTDYPFTRREVTVIDHYEGSESILGLYTIAQLRNNHNIDSNLTNQEALEEIERIVNEPLPTPIATPEERIAAALEFQNLLSL